MIHIASERIAILMQFLHRFYLTLSVGWILSKSYSKREPRKWRMVIRQSHDICGVFGHWPKSYLISNYDLRWCILDTSFHLGTSLTRLLVYVVNFGHLQQWNFAQYHTLFCTVVWKIVPKLNKPSKYCQSGEISLNLVTLLGTYVVGRNMIASNFL